jgi:hypothetical protein
MTTVKSDLCTALTAQNTTQNNCIVLHSQNRTALQPNVFLNGIRWLLVTNKERSAFASPDNYQGQTQTPQSVSVLLILSRPLYLTSFANSSQFIRTFCSQQTTLTQSNRTQVYFNSVVTLTRIQRKI